LRSDGPRILSLAIKKGSPTDKSSVKSGFGNGATLRVADFELK
jgi:hypothetical protein